MWLLSSYKTRLAEKVDARAWVADYVAPLVDDDGDVLEVGCGPGVLFSEIASRFSRVNAIGFDRSVDRLAEAQRNFTGLSNASSRKGDAHQLPFEDGSFDLVYSRFLVE